MESQVQCIMGNLPVNGVGTIFTQKLLLNFTNNYKETARNIELNMTF